MTMTKLSVTYLCENVNELQNSKSVFLTLTHKGGESSAESPASGAKTHRESGEAAAFWTPDGAASGCRGQQTASRCSNPHPHSPPPPPGGCYLSNSSQTST